MSGDGHRRDDATDGRGHPWAAHPGAAEPERGFFGRITRYGYRALGDPGENRLTEITAAVLDTDPALGRAFAAGLLRCAERAAEAARLSARDAAGRDEPSALEKRLAAMLDELYSAPAACPRAATQVHTRGRGFVDLELRLESGDLVRDLVLWIEVKHGAPVHGDQLSVYEQDLRDSVTAGAGRQLIVLAPRQSLPDERAVPTDVPVVTWQALARELQAWAAEHRPQQPTRFLLDEYLTYLDEERLMDRGEFTAEMAQAIALREIASDTIAALCEVTRGHMPPPWQPPSAEEERYGVAAFGPGYYATYDPPDPWWGGWLEWGLLQNDDHSWAFMAGATLPDGGAIPDDQQETVAALADQEFNVFEFGRKVRIARVINPADLVGRGSLDDQARYLAEQIADAFDAVLAHEQTGAV